MGNSVLLSYEDREGLISWGLTWAGATAPASWKGVTRYLQVRHYSASRAGGKLERERRSLAADYRACQAACPRLSSAPPVSRLEPWSLLRPRAPEHPPSPWMARVAESAHTTGSGQHAATEGCRAKTCWVLVTRAVLVHVISKTYTDTLYLTCLAQHLRAHPPPCHIHQPSQDRGHRCWGLQPPERFVLGAQSQHPKANQLPPTTHF